MISPLALLSLALALAAPTSAAEPMKPFEFSAKLEPAFFPHSQLTLRSSEDSTELTLTIADKTTSFPVDSTVAARFLREATAAPVIHSKYQPGLDGINVHLRFQVAGTQVLASKVWSPTKESAPTEHALMQALYHVTEHAKLPAAQAEYLEHLYNFFDNIQPHWKVLGGTPFTIRFYARLSVHAIPEFRTLVASFPKDRETIFDLTNLDRTGTLFYEEFLKANQQHTIKWRAHSAWAKELSKIGIPNDRIILIDDQPGNQ